MSLESDKKPHISKTFSIANIIQIVIIVFGGATVYATNKADVAQIKQEQIELRDSTIKKETLEQMFKVRDTEIKNVSKQVDDIKQKIDENQKLLIQLIQRPNP